MINNNSTTIMSALFRDRDDAEKAYQEILDRGFTRDQISVLMSDEARQRFGSTTTRVETTKAAEGTGVGAVIGGTLGAIIGAIAAIGTNVVLPGLGLVVAGPLVAALVGAGAGGATGSLVGALIGWGIPEETARGYEEGLREGGIVLGFEPRSTEEANEIREVWRSYNGELLHG